MADAGRLGDTMTENSILIVDDELESLKGVIDFFRRINWKVITAVDEKEAVLEFERINPCLVLLDMVLERESGFEVLSSIRRLNSQSKVIIISKYFDGELIKQAIKAGAIGFVQKTAPERLPAGFESLVKDAIF